jgi:SAM-dependent methyltransferase
VTCRVCSAADLSPLWTDGDGFAWARCPRCGSDTSAAPYQPDRYGLDYARDLLFQEGPTPLHNHQHNADLFERHHAGKPGRTFLDVGCGAGASLEVMRGRGWACVGWDVSADGRPAGAVVSPEFRADLFAHRSDAVLCREVIEHVPDPRGLVRELYAATAAGGVMQLTTPRPIAKPEWRCYHWAHLCVWSVDALRAELVRAGFDPIETDVWELGQRHVCRRPG